VSDVRELRGYDLVVAADGVNSAARGALFGDAYGPSYVGATAWRGTVDGDTPDFTETWGEGARFGVTPQEGNRTNWYACVLAPERQRFRDGEAAAVRRHFGHWHGEVRRVLAGISEETVARNDLYYLSRQLPSYVHGRTALIGDAAHAMTPDLGRGACEAIVDAVTLAESVSTLGIEPGLRRLRQAAARSDAADGQGVAAGEPARPRAPVHRTAGHGAGVSRPLARLRPRRRRPPPHRLPPTRRP
jgi:2-polyprenyl-6-methoxyphenol hydroxylase-like FAD-dependent oxidoreductase